MSDSLEELDEYADKICPNNVHRHNRSCDIEVVWIELHQQCRYDEELACSYAQA